MRFEFKPSFARSVKGLHPREQTEVKEAASSLVRSFNTGMTPAGLGLDHLKGEYWEVRAGLRVRLLFSRQRDLIVFIAAGSHDDVRRFLRRL